MFAEQTIGGSQSHLGCTFTGWTCGTQRRLGKVLRKSQGETGSTLRSTTPGADAPHRQSTKSMRRIGWTSSTQTLTASSGACR